MNIRSATYTGGVSMNGELHAGKTSINYHDVWEALAMRPDVSSNYGGIALMSNGGKMTRVMMGTEGSYLNQFGLIQMDQVGGFKVDSTKTGAATALPLYFAVDGQTAMTIYNGKHISVSKDLSIGTPNGLVDEKLWVYDETDVWSMRIGKSAGPNLRMTGTGSTNKAYIQAFSDESTASNLHLNPSGGNVGIGTTAPSTKLEVAGTTSTNILNISGGAVTPSVTEGMFWYNTVGHVLSIYDGSTWRKLW
jgi:hypothetical protein